jgi:integrase
MPTIHEAIEVFSTEFQFEPDTNTKRTYLAALNTWCKYLRRSHQNPQDTDVGNLQPDVITRFSGWMREAKPSPHSSPVSSTRRPKPTSQFSPATIRLYQQALLRALGFWRSHGWISFYADQEVATRTASSIRARRKKSVQSRRSTLVPRDFGLRMVAEACDIPLPENTLKYYRLNVLRTRALICILASTGLRISDACMLMRHHYKQALSSSGLFNGRIRLSISIPKHPESH